ncbi:hypothetical protein CEXT_517531 [Caerostris extrusa]|uniref:Ribosomal protein S14 n=1 Tax=Caerostris extrusa TaxID=172846 RepID=A0AAV4U6Z4_CAEEX|nr:hypothetical protein CEXT_517531 [Caerostris extrusa]
MIVNQRRYKKKSTFMTSNGHRISVKRFLLRRETLQKVEHTKTWSLCLGERQKIFPQKLTYLIPPVRLQPILQADRKSSGARDPLIPLNPRITNPRMKDDPQWVGICKLPGTRHGGANHIYLGTQEQKWCRYSFSLSVRLRQSGGVITSY